MGEDRTGNHNRKSSIQISVAFSFPFPCSCTNLLNHPSTVSVLRSIVCIASTKHMSQYYLLSFSSTRHFLLATSSIHASVSSCVASTQLSEKATHVLLPSAIQLLQLVIKHASFLERVVCLVQFQCRARILDRVVWMFSPRTNQDRRRSERRRWRLRKK